MVEYPNSRDNGQFRQPSLAELNESMRSKEGSSTILQGSRAKRFEVLPLWKRRG